VNERKLEGQAKVLHLEVQRQLGWTLIRIQQCELLMKALVAAAKVEGTPDTMEEFMDKRRGEFSKDQFGALIEEARKTFLSDSAPKDDIESIAPPDKVFLRMQFKLEPIVPALAQLDAFRLLRNDVVHHFVDRHDVFSEAGCTVALEYLGQSYSTIDAMCLQLRAWLQSHHGARQAFVQLVQSAPFADLLISDGTAAVDSQLNVTTINPR
jgi:hypothetical protein